MGLMDRVREQAAQLAQKTQEAAQEGRVMLDQAQARRRADAMFRDLGAAVYAERTGRAGWRRQDRAADQGAVPAGGRAGARRQQLPAVIAPAVAAPAVAAPAVAA